MVQILNGVGSGRLSIIGSSLKECMEFRSERCIDDETVPPDPSKYIDTAQ